MKINHNSLINLVNEKTYLDHHLNYIDKKIEEQGEEIHKTYQFLMNCKRQSILMKNRRRLIFSKKTTDNVFSNYLVPKTIRYDVLRTLPSRSDAIQIDQDILLHYDKLEQVIICNFHIRKEDRVYNYFFLIDIVNDKVFRDNRNTLSDEHFIEHYFSTFMLAVTYLELTPVTLEVLERNRSTSNTKKEGKIKNDSDRVIIVQTNWNVQKIDLRDIHVRGHWRLQPYGIGRTQYKYIFIQPFEKGITRRLPQKELV